MTSAAVQGSNSIMSQRHLSVNPHHKASRKPVVQQEDQQAQEALALLRILAGQAAQPILGDLVGVVRQEALGLEEAVVMKMQQMAVVVVACNPLP